MSDESLPVKRGPEESPEVLVKKTKGPTVSETDWEPYAAVLRNIQWPEDDDSREAKTAIAEKLATVEGLQEIIEQLTQQVNERSEGLTPVEIDPDFSQLNISQQIQSIYHQVFSQ